MNLDKSLLFPKNIPHKWSELSYAGVSRVPFGVETEAYSWPLFYLRRNAEGKFIDPEGEPIAFEIRNPERSVDFAGLQLSIVRDTLKNITRHQILVAKYWDEGPPTKQFTPIIDRLIDTYSLSAPQAARVLGAVQAGLNDALVVCWYFKYLWDIPRPNQLDQNLTTITCTPNHPSYPAGHAVVAGCAEVILSYFFAPERSRLHELAEECAESRLYAGVHYPIDNDEGLRLGRQIGQITVSVLKKQQSSSGCLIDYPILENRQAQLPPPPYQQAIPYPRPGFCESKTIPTLAAEDSLFPEFKDPASTEPI